MKRMIRGAVHALGYDVVRYRPEPRPAPAARNTPLPTYPPDTSADEQAILGRVAPYTMTSVDRQIALIQAVRSVVARNVPGCVVECGVWRGGSTMAAALTLIQEGATGRNVYLYDTFEGMTPPTDHDKTSDGTLARAHLAGDADKQVYWCVADLDDVTRNMRSTGYPPERVRYVKGPVEQTIPAHLPAEPIALLRLDTDWYESTRHELAHLYPLLSEGGVLIIDDYGHWAGARKAVDEYLAGLGHRYYLHRIDYTGRLLVKR